MHPIQIAADVDRGLAIVAELEALKKELKAIESRLEAAGLTGETIPLEEAEREGRQFLAAGTDLVVPVRFESDQLIATIPHNSPQHGAQATLLGEHFGDFWQEKRIYERTPKDGLAFRQALQRTLFPGQAAKVLAQTLARDKDGIPKSRTVVDWSRARKP